MFTLFECKDAENRNKTEVETSKRSRGKKELWKSQPKGKKLERVEATGEGLKIVESLEESYPYTQ